MCVCVKLKIGTKKIVFTSIKMADGLVCVNEKNIDFIMLQFDCN